MKKIISVSMLLFFMHSINAQNPLINDTIEYARSKAYAKDFTEADRLLTIYTSHNSNINAMRLHAQVLYWMNEPERSMIVFEKILKIFPEVQVVKLDYGRMLFELNKLQRAEFLLNDYLMTDRQNPEANILLAQINYWKGHIKTARERLAVVLNVFPENETALAVLQEINNATAPYLQIGSDFASDDQPLKKTGFNAEMGWYNSWFFSPIIQANSYLFNTGNSTKNSSWVQAGNKLIFGHTGLSLIFKAGIFNHPGSVKPIYTGSGLITQKISNASSFFVTTEKRPYQYTSTSAAIPVMHQVTDAGFNFNKNNKWLGKAAYELQRFDDANKIQTIYAWALLPLIHHQKLKLKAGYSFNHSNTDINTFTSLNSLSTVIASYPAGSLVPGYYNPYFTPNDQTVNSLLAYLEVQLSKKTSFILNANMGVSASSNNPQLVLTRNTGNIYSIKKQYAKQPYSPIEFRSEISSKLSDRLTFSGKYEYGSLLFYTINQGSFVLKYAFVHAGKK